jgi:uncharacterized RDD family membrane protein YckC
MVDSATRWCPCCHSNVQDPSLGKLASPGRRLAASVIDLFILTLVIGGVFAVEDPQVKGEYAGGGLETFLFGVLIAYVVLVIVLFAHGTTPGKRVLGLYVIKANGQRAGFGKMLYREWFFKSMEGVLGLILLVLSGVMMFIDKDRQALHDKIGQTYVVGKN